MLFVETFLFVSAFQFYAITSRMAQQSRRRTFCVSKSGVVIAGADLGGSSSYSSEAALQERMIQRKNTRIILLSCRNESFERKVQMA